MIPGKTNEEGEEVDRKGEMPIQGALMSELLLWESGAQSHEGPSGESFEDVSNIPLRDRDAGISIHRVMSSLFKGCPGKWGH